jgi:hypothetical protein
LASLHVVAPLLLKWKKQICFLVWLKVLEILNRGFYEILAIIAGIIRCFLSTLLQFLSAVSGALHFSRTIVQSH